jgi:hypothetical protein
VKNIYLRIVCQGDPMIFWKKSPNSLFVKLNMYVPFTSGQLCPKFCATSVIIKELLKENNHPIGHPATGQANTCTRKKQ